VRRNCGQVSRLRQPKPRRLEVSPVFVRHDQALNAGLRLARASAVAPARVAHQISDRPARVFARACFQNR
jgi:hypothetical protein